MTPVPSPGRAEPLPAKPSARGAELPGPAAPSPGRPVGAPAPAGPPGRSAPPAGWRPPPSTSDLEQRAREVVRVERPQVLERLADPDQLHRNPELLSYRKSDAALRRAVELREHDPVHVD